MELSKEEQEAIEMLDKFTTEHKLYNIKQSDNLEGNIETVLNLISKLQKENEKQGKVIDEMVDLISCECEDDWIEELWNIADGNIKELIKQYFYRKVENENEL